MTKRVLTVVGARPQFIKAAAISRALRASAALEEILVHTGQHHDDNMSDVFFRELDIPEPHLRLGIAGGGHGEMTGRMLAALEGAMLQERPDIVLIYGDTNSTLAGALAAAKLHIPIAHVEAGLRSFNRRMPEEINRIVADHVSDVLLCPTQTAVDNLAREGVTAGVHAVGDVMFDATRFAAAEAAKSSTIVGELGVSGAPFALCTLHRAETTDNPETLARAIAFVENVARSQTVIFPVHPRTRKTLEASGRTLANVRMIAPVGYFDMHALLGACQLVLTDSGGLQKEAYFHRKTCITLRDETEWVETVEAGWNRLWTAAEWKAPRRDIPDYGDGHAAEAGVAVLEQFLSA